MKQKKAIIRIFDEVNCAILNLEEDHLKMFYEQFARAAPNYYFNPKYKLGQWDGYIRYFHKTGKTYVYLLEEIIPKLTSLDYSIEVDDQRDNSNFVQPEYIDKDHFSHIIDPESNNPIELAEHQVNLVNALIDGGGGVGIAGTGAGKTFMVAALADQYNKYGSSKTITIVPNADLISQTIDEFEFVGLDTGEYSGDKKDIEHDHVVSTWQALQNNPDIIKFFQLVIVDEAHGLRGSTLTNLLNEYGSKIPHRFGVTGTMPKAETEAMSVRVAVGDIRYEITAKQLMDAGWLAKLDIDIIQLEEDFTDAYNKFIEQNPTSSKTTYKQFKEGYFPDYQAEKSYLQKDKRRLEWIAEYLDMKRDEKKGNVFCLVSGVQFGKKLAKQIDDATFVHGKDKKAARNEIYQTFEDNDNVIVIATVDIASTGLDIKRIYNLVLVDMGKSFIRTIQSIGRGLRKAADKDAVKVTDICSDLKYSKRHMNERVKYYKEAEYPYRKIKIDYEQDDNIC